IIARYSFGPTDIPMWKREQFPDVTYEEYKTIKEVPNVEAVSYSLYLPASPIKYQGKQVAGVDIAPVTHEYYDIEALQLEEGRFFNAAESNSGSQVIVLGANIAENLFGGQNP